MRATGLLLASFAARGLVALTLFALFARFGAVRARAALLEAFGRFWGAAAFFALVVALRGVRPLP